MSEQKTCRKITKQLFVPLTAEEREDKIQQLLGNVNAKKECQLKIDANNDENKQWKDNIKLFDQNIIDFSNTIEHGRVEEVECVQILDWLNNEIVIMEPKSGRVIEKREMTDEDQPRAMDESYKEEV